MVKILQYFSIILIAVLFGCNPTYTSSPKVSSASSKSDSKFWIQDVISKIKSCYYIDPSGRITVAEGPTVEHYVSKDFIKKKPELKAALGEACYTINQAIGKERLYIKEVEIDSESLVVSLASRSRDFDKKMIPNDSLNKRYIILIDGSVKNLFRIEEDGLGFCNALSINNKWIYSTLGISLECFVEKALLRVSIIHELLHSLGMKHSNYLGDVMYPDVNNDTALLLASQGYLSEKERWALKAVYYDLERFEKLGL